MIKSAVFTLIEGLARTTRASYKNGYISKRQLRYFVRSLTRFRLTRPNSKAGEIRIEPFVFHYPDAKAFAYNFEEVFLDEEYFFKSASEQPVIVDCGANIGLATLYFKMAFPAARVMAIEANPETYAVLEKNIAANSLAEVTPLNVALTASDDEQMTFMFAGAGDLRATGVGDHDVVDRPLREVTVKAAKLSSLLPNTVDLIKMDIEGGEHDVIDDISAKLGQIANVIIEYHHFDGHKGKSLGKFISVLEQHGFICRIKASNPPDIDSRPRDSYVATIYGSRA